MSTGEIEVREADLDGPDAGIVGELVRAYLLQTETERYEHGERAAPGGVVTLSSAHEREAASPAVVYSGARTFLATSDGVALGVVVVRSTDGETEVKRLWADPGARGRGVGSALLETAISAAESAVKLSVWDWRTAAIGLYESRGFVRVESWEARQRLVCMRRNGTPVSSSRS